MTKNNCESCGKTITAGAPFYRCRTEIISGFDGVIQEPEDGADSLIEEACKEMAGRSPQELMDDVYEKISILLCPACRQKIRELLLPMKKNRKKTDNILLFPPRFNSEDE